MRWSRYGPEYRDPQTDKEYYRKPLAELTEEQKFELELRKTQLIKAAPATKTSSVFEDPLIRLDGNTFVPLGRCQGGAMIRVLGYSLGKLNMLLFPLK